MNTIKVTNTPTPIMSGLNFLTSEFWTPAGQDFYVHQCIPLALQVFRDYFSKLFPPICKWHIMSTYRPWDPSWLPAAHRESPAAVDSVSLNYLLWDEIRSKIRNELKMWETSELVKNVLTTGTNVVIIENGCLHLHYRTTNLHTTKDYGKIYLGEWGMKNGKQYNVAYSIDQI